MVLDERAPDRSTREEEPPWSQDKPYSADAWWVVQWISKHRDNGLDERGRVCDIPARQDDTTRCGSTGVRWPAELGVDWTESGTASVKPFEGALVGAGNLVNYLPRNQLGIVDRQDLQTFPHWTVLYVEGRDQFRQRQRGSVASQVVGYSLVPSALVLALALVLRRRILRAGL
jgi:hypothetical protein